MRIRVPSLRRTSISLCIALVTVAAPGVAAAQEPATPAPGSFCTLFTNAEASEAFGIDLVLTGVSGKSCTWSPTGGSSMDASLVPSLFPGTLADNKAYYKDFPGGIKDITVAGQPGLLRTSKDPWMSGVIFAESLGEVLQIQWDDYAGKAAKAKVAAALKQVMEAALPRMASISFAEPSQRPAPSYRTDVDLAAMFPKTINGQPVTPQTYYLEDLFAAFGDTNEMGPQIAAVLATQGKTLDDVTGGLFQVPNTDPAASLSALRVIGADAATLVDPLLPLFSASTQGATIASATVAGRDVRTVTDPSSGAVTYVLPSGDVLWLVVAQEPILSEILGALP